MQKKRWPRVNLIRRNVLKTGISLIMRSVCLFFHSWAFSLIHFRSEQRECGVCYFFFLSVSLLVALAKPMFNIVLVLYPCSTLRSAHKFFTIRLLFATYSFNLFQCARALRVFSSHSLFVSLSKSKSSHREIANKF